jgi:hypothetical protein
VIRYCSTKAKMKMKDGRGTNHVTKSSRCSWLGQAAPGPPGRRAEVAATHEQQSLGAAAPERREPEAGASEPRASGSAAWPERRAPISRVHGGRPAVAAGVRQRRPPGASGIQQLPTPASGLEASAATVGRRVHDSRGRYGRRATLRDAGGIDGENESFFPDDRFVSELRGCN